MQFTSVTFVFYFLPAFLALYMAVSKTYFRNVLLLLASLGFYAWGEFRYVLLLCLAAFVNYAIAPLIARQHGSLRSLLLWTGIAVNLAPLVTFKYAAFLIQAAQPIFALLGTHSPAPKLDLPLGISFFTFKAISYLVDVHRKDVLPERDPIVFAAYLTMFPQILAGPIERLSDAQGEMRHRRITLAKFRLGAEYFIAGMGAKLLIANTLSGPADTAFSTPATALSAPLAWLGLGAYTLQIYFDFAGYTNMAIGLGHMMGFTFPRNFNHPYAAKSITDFWQRWHITLSRWFRDYVWYPLGANRGAKIRTYLNLMFVFLLCGLWHGANYTFLVWGLFHGALLVIERAGLLSLLKRAGGLWGNAYSLFMVMIGWVLFRADSLPHAARFLTALFGASPVAAAVPPLRGLSPEVVTALCVGALFAFPIPKLVWDTAISASSARIKDALGATATLVMMTLFVIALMSIAEGSHNPFLYFRF